jgi:thioredoxin-related protein
MFLRLEINNYLSMNKSAILLILISPLVLVAQEQGMVFEHHLGWQEILQKAKSENKYIFVDCYASWCGPCKWMDRNIYSNDTVAEIMNKGFVSVKIQMDSTAHDDAEIKKWYAASHTLARQYRIKEYPSYLFFSPDGRAVHKGVGATDMQGFLTLTKMAVDPGRQYYTLLSRYEHGDLEPGAIITLVNMTAGLGEDSLASAIAGYYLHHSLDGLSNQELWTKDNLNFINAYRHILHYSDELFQRYMKHVSLIDSVMRRKEYARKLVDYVVYDENVKPEVDAGLRDNVEPKWNKMEREIDEKYGDGYAKRNIIIGKVAFYRSRKLWKLYVAAIVREVRETNFQSDLSLNNVAFEVFKYSNKRKELIEALSWINRAVATRTDPRAESFETDTKANLLYKLGRRNEAIALEEKAARLAPNDMEVQNAYERMKKGLPTWQ